MGCPGCCPQPPQTRSAVLPPTLPSIRPPSAGQALGAQPGCSRGSGLGLPVGVGVGRGTAHVGQCGYPGDTVAQGRWGQARLTGECRERVWGVLVAFPPGHAPCAPRALTGWLGAVPGGWWAWAHCTPLTHADRCAWGEPTWGGCFQELSPGRRPWRPGGRSRLAGGRSDASRAVCGVRHRAGGGRELCPGLRPWAGTPSGPAVLSPAEGGPAESTERTMKLAVECNVTRTLVGWLPRLRPRCGGCGALRPGGVAPGWGGLSGVRFSSTRSTGSA